ncbi:hypothetical protein HOY82DRAFT_582293 [Tuber indicum]|nr:hypothetical protein HOY82DRAFT_582293 [Tuber indicum]
MLTCYLTKAVNELKPVKVYNNFKEDRVQLIKDNNKKEAIYCLINGHSYIGSSNNLAGRMPLLKYGKNNFAILIIEYVNFDKLAIRETHFISKLLPYYNVLKEGYSSVGYKHTEATKDMLSELAKNREHSDQTKVLISAALTESKLKIINDKSAYPVYIYDSYKKLLIVFPSVKTLANVINSNSATIVNYIKNEALFRAEKELKISHDTIKKYAPLNKPFGDYIFSYEILKD